MKSLEGRAIEDYSIDLATRLGVGPKASNRGVLILVAVDDHQYRTEVGYGLEAILPDGKVGGFGREAVPYFRNNDYDSALLLITRRIADVIAADRGVSLTGESPAAPNSGSGERRLTSGQIILLFFGIFLVYSIIRRATGGSGSRFNRPGGGWWIGPMMGEDSAAVVLEEAAGEEGALAVSVEARSAAEGRAEVGDASRHHKGLRNHGC